MTLENYKEELLFIIQNQFKLTCPLGSKDNNESQNFEWSLTSTVICTDEARALNPPWRGFTGGAKSALPVHFSSSIVSYSLQLHTTPWTAASQASLSITNSWRLLKLMHISDAIQPPHPLSSPSPPTFNLSQHQVISNEFILHIRWPKDWSLSFSISPSNEHLGLILFRMDWLDLLAVQRTLKSLL